MSGGWKMASFQLSLGGAESLIRCVRGGGGTVPEKKEGGILHCGVEREYKV
jgi:hypothetical protein